MLVKLLTEHHLEFLSLKGLCKGSYESTLVKILHCLKSHSVAQMGYCISIGDCYMKEKSAGLLLQNGSGNFPLMIHCINKEASTRTKQFFLKLIDHRTYIRKYQI